MALTDTFVKQVKWSGAKNGDKYSDGGSMYLHVKAAGKYWRMDYKCCGKRNIHAIGVYPAVTLAQARKRRDAARELLAQGVDPNGAKREAQQQRMVAQSNTLEVVATEFLELKKPAWSDTHYERESRNITNDLLPWLGTRPIGDISPPELLAVLRKVEARGAVESAKRVRVTASGVWAYAIASGRAERNITLDIRQAMKPSQKTKHAALIKPLEVGALLRAMGGYTGGPVVYAALQLAPILFQRPGNLRTMRWVDLDLESGLWTIPSEDMKRTKEGKANGQPHYVPLPTQAVGIIKGLQPLTGHREYVFPGARDPKRPMSEAAVTAALAGIGYKGLQSWHGFRATGRTMLRQELKFDVDTIEAQLAHVGQITHGGAYDRADYFDERKGMLQTWADYLDKLRAGADVIPLHVKSA